MKDTAKRRAANRTLAEEKRRAARADAEKIFDGLTAWMDSADTMDLAELRQVRRMMGDNVEHSEREFLSWLEKLKQGLVRS